MQVRMITRLFRPPRSFTPPVSGPQAAALIWHSTDLPALAGLAAALMYAVFLVTQDAGAAGTRPPARH